ncbi:S26 family signal peptidase [Nonomuraea guangzhouensis]|uniref:signal peptidase I n=1 Tax=Nonomuraea guangzhouensis TaxID=1291555 RepID=A0ABW4G6I4_9ACTN|nr:S26 family signal peptidase [Nonomuraea guangzhouensis]
MIGAIAVLVAVGGVLAVVRLRRRYMVVTVHGESMLPTYRPGERLVLRRTPPRSLRTGQVVVLTEPGHSEPDAPLSGTSTGPYLIIKRVAALPGDPIPRDTVPALRTAPGTRVPDGHLVVLGDNADRSHDSRHSGYLTTDRLLGVVLRKVAR